MCAMSNSHTPRFNRSIVRVVDRIESSGSDYHSDNDLDHHMSSCHVDVSTQTVTACCQHGLIDTQICSNGEDLSSEKVYKRPTSFDSQSPLHNSHVRRQSHRSPSPDLYRTVTNEHQIPIGLHKSISADNLSLSSLKGKLTGDSGTGGSMGHLPPVTSTNPVHYEVVPIHGRQITALMAHRFIFDQSKIDAYLEHKYDTSSLPPSIKPPNSNISILSTTPKNTRQNTNNSPSITKSNGFFSRILRKPFKSAPINHALIQATIIHRHHTSQIEEKDDQ